MFEAALAHLWPLKGNLSAQYQLRAMDRFRDKKVRGGMADHKFIITPLICK